MTEKYQLLSDIIEVRTNFHRSVSLEKDYRADNKNQNEYIVTLSARKTLRVIIEGLEGEGPFRSITLTGPYGVGKSAFALFLSQLFCGSPSIQKTAFYKLQKADPRLSQLFSECNIFQNGSKGYLPILMTLRRSPASYCILQGAADSLLSTKDKVFQNIGARLQTKIEKAGDNLVIDSRFVVEEIDGIAKAAVKLGYDGVLFIADELGKVFEYAARDSHKGDVFVLQEIAEKAARSGDSPLVVIGLLHQGFDEYAKHLDMATRQEWTKIQGRFNDIAFQEPAEQLIRLIAEAIEWQVDDKNVVLSRCLRDLSKKAISVGINPPSMSKEEFDEICTRCYPLHPTTLIALPILFNRFTQNERSLFSFLTSLEAGGFQNFLRNYPFNPERPRFFRLSHLFDYFTINFGAGIYRQPHARRLLEAADALDRKEKLTTLHEDLIKTIGILSVLGEFSHVRSTEAAIALSVDDKTKFTRNIKAKMNELRETSLLTFRKFNNTYKIWEGSDIDIEERIDEGIRRIKHFGLSNIIEKYVVKRPMVARRHSFETGFLRYFDLRYVDDPDEIELPKREESKADGIIFVCLSETENQAVAFRKRAVDAKERMNVLFAIPQQIGELRSAAVELAGLRWAWNNTPGLRDDRVARREMAIRITEAEQLLTRSLEGLLDPRPEPVGSSCLWFWNGERPNDQVKNRSDVLQLLSDVCNDLYYSTPSVRNELVSRRSLSSAAAAARRNLIEAMLTKHDLPLLGIEGFPPERSIYESFLYSTGIHSETRVGIWGFSPPTESIEHNLRPTWEHLYSRVFANCPEMIPVDILYAELSSPPYGVLDGLHPLLLCAFLQTYPDETTLYREGTFIPIPSVADYEVLLRRPELFSISGTKVVGAKQLVVERLAKGLNTKPATVAVVRKLFAMMKGLPDFAWHSRRLPKTTIALREAFRGAKSPERFLFEELPEALQMPDFYDSNPKKKDINDFFKSLNKNLQNLYDAKNSAISNARDILLKACGFGKGEENWQVLRNTAVVLETSETEPNLLAFLKRVIQSGADAPGIEAVLALVANRAPKSWTDADMDRFPFAAASIGKSFKDAVGMRGLNSNSDAIFAKLSPEEKQQAEDILKYVRRYLNRNVNTTSSRAFHAAIISLLEEMNDD